MQIRGIFGLTAIVVISFSVGCSMSKSTVRGQNPDNNGPVIGSAPGYGDFKSTPYLGRHDHHDFKPLGGAVDHNFGYDGGFYAGPEGYYTEGKQAYMADSAGCQQCNNGQSCPQSGCHGCGRGCGYRNGMPQHVQTYQYDWPENMVYPPQFDPAGGIPNGGPNAGGVPAGMVQYPYYTLRGPTDFFMK